MFASSFWFWDKPSWGEAELWALAFLLIPSLLVRRGGSRFLTGLLLGKDRRWSTSKASVALWTYAILFAFIAILLHTRGSGLNDIKLSDQYLLLIGIPAATAVSAAGVTQSNVASGKLTKTPATQPPTPLEGVGQLVSDDVGNADLLDAQYLAFSIVLLAYFLTQFLSAESVALPTLPATLVGLTGVSAVGYIAKKGLERDPPPVTP
jgi:hypothetical protein